jgi:pimeloyl-ACP methyl ester carboxylesterase
METYAADLAALLDLLGVDDVVLVGLSMGGYIAFEFLRRWRQRVRGLVLLDTRAEADTPDGKKNRDAAAATAREQGAEAIAEAMLPKVLGASTLAGAPATVERVRAMMAATPVAGIVGALGAMRDRPDSTPMLPGLAGVPTLVIVGDEDELTPPAQARAMADAIPGASLVVIRSAGHLPTIERPAETTDALLAFLDGLP